MKPKATREELNDMYNRQGLALDAIAKLLKVSVPTVYSWMDYFGLPHNRRKEPRLPEQRTCAYCGKGITVKPGRIEKSISGLVFCSKTCSAHYRSSQLEPNAQCYYCGQQFHRSPSELERRNVVHPYCSRECYERARQEGVAAKRQAGVDRHGAHEIPCDQCGKPIYLRPSQLRSAEHHFCSVECRRRFQTTTGTYASREHMRRQYKQCQICGLKEPDILVVHHKDGDRGNNVYDNLVIICPNCHARIHKGLIQI